MNPFTDKQREYRDNATHRWNLAVGAVRSGKSHMAIRWTIPMCVRERHGLKGINLVLGVTKESIERNVLAPMRDMWGDRHVGYIGSRNFAILFGEKVYCIGAENIGQASKLRGSEVKFCYCDELADIHPDVFDILKSRLSLPYSQCHAACNPAGPRHYVKRFIDEAPERGIDLYCQQYTIWDNPYLPEEYVRALEAEYSGTVYYDRYIKGLWTQAEGLVYQNHVKALEQRYTGEVRQWVISIDYGTRNPFAALKWCEDPEGVWHCVDEYTYSGRETGHDKTDGEYLDELEAFCGDIPDERVTVIIDPSASSFIALLKRSGRFRVRQARNDVLEGIRETAACIQRGTVKVWEGCKRTVDEFGSYVWDDRSDSDKVMKENDHCMDAMRYLVATLRLAKPLRAYTPVLGLE